MAHERASFAQEVRGLRAKLHHERRHKEKIQMKKTCVVPFEVYLSIRALEEEALTRVLYGLLFVRFPVSVLVFLPQPCVF